MKLTVRTLIFGAAILVSLNSYAEKCFLTVQEYIPEAGCSHDLKEYPSFESKNWQGCFNSAQNLSEEIGYESSPQFIAIDKLACKTTYAGNTVPKRTVLWQFKDAFIPLMSSNGVLNKETSKHLKAPAKGNQTFDLDGNKLF